MPQTTPPNPLININHSIADINQPFSRYSDSHKGFYDFRYLTPMGEPMRSHAIETLFMNITSFTVSKGNFPHPRHLRLKDFFSWVFAQSLENQTHHMKTVGNCLRAGKSPSAHDWQLVVNDFRSRAIAPPKDNPFTNGESDLTKNLMFDHVRGGLKILEVEGLLPPSTLRGIKGARNRSRANKSMGEITRSTLSKEKIEELLGGYLNNTPGGTEVDKQQAQDFYSSLASEGIAVADNEEDQLQQLLDLNNERLALLRKCAEDDLIIAWEFFQTGQNLIDGCGLSYEEDMHELVEDLLREQAAGTLKGNYPGAKGGHPFKQLLVGEDRRTKFDIDHPSFKDKLARCLTFIDGRYCGLFPCSSDQEGNIWELGRFTHTHTNKHLINAGYVRQHIEPTPYALFSAILILLIDTGFNLTVIQDLKIDGTSEVEELNKLLLTGSKRRANNKDQNALLDIADDNRLSSPDVIEIIRTMTERYRKVANGESQSRWRNPIISIDRTDLHRYLFICRQEQTKLEKRRLIAGITPATVIGAIKDMRTRHVRLHDLSFAPENIRPSVAIKKFFEAELDIESARINLGQKSKTCAPKYVIRTASRIVLQKMMRTYQNRLETIMIKDIPGAAEKLGFTPDEYKLLIADAERTGLGTICNEFKKLNGKTVSVKEKACNPEEDCPDCPLMKIIPASQENLVDLIVHHEYLETNRERLENENPQRWNKIYAKWWALTKAAIEKIKIDSSVSRKVFKEAMKEAKDMGIEMFPQII